MKRRYNVALIPVLRQQEFIQFAQQFRALSAGYLLGEMALPHVTLCQFTADENAIAAIWDEICLYIRPKQLKLRFEKMTKGGLSNAFWIMLEPDQFDVLKAMHYAVANIIQVPLNLSYENYYPHLTLLNSYDENYEAAMLAAEKTYVPFEDQFVLSLGLSGDFGQYQRVIFR